MGTTFCSNPQSNKQLKGGITMNILYKTTLLITMAVVTWKVVKIEKNTRFKFRNFDYPKINNTQSKSLLDIASHDLKDI